MKKIMLSSKLISLIFSTLVLCFAVVSLSYAAWTAPTSTPPNDTTTPTFLNTNTDGQIKQGGLTVHNSPTFSNPAKPYGLLIPYGRVGIGTIDPIGQLQVAKDIRLTTTYTPLPISSTNNDYPTTPNPTGYVASIDIIGSSDIFRLAVNDGNGNINQYLNSYSDGANSSKYAIAGRSAARFNINGNSFSFWGAPSGSAGASITWNSVKVGIGRSPATNALEVEGNASKTASGSWSANSDIRIKKDIQNITNAVDTLEKLRPVKFKYTNEYREEHPTIDDTYYYNFIAQEFQQVFPDSVKMENGTGLLQLDTYVVTPYVVRAIQEQQKEIESLKEEIKVLKTRLNIEQ